MGVTMATRLPLITALSMTALLKKASFYLNLAPLNKIPLFDNGAAEIFPTSHSKKIKSRRGRK
jgi:hypothetical protein